MPKKKSASSKSGSSKRNSSASSKRSSAGTSRRKSRKEPSPQEYFFFADGRVAKNIKELAFLLDEISDDVFRHHVNDSKNDFANWVRDIFDERDLAEIIAAETEAAKLQLEILKHLVKKHVK